MKTKLIITESQLERLKTYILESDVQSSIIKQMKAELDANYTPTEQYAREGGEYHNMPMVTVKVDKEIISPKALFDYMKFKYKMGDEFTKQVISDWMFNKITDDYSLSKNVPIK
jgi:hypothetical protein